MPLRLLHMASERTNDDIDRVDDRGLVAVSATAIDFA